VLVVIDGRVAHAGDAAALEADASEAVREFLAGGATHE
jgi:hypothetical protein